MRSPMVLLTVAALVLGRLLGAGFDVTSVALARDFRDSGRDLFARWRAEHCHGRFPAR